MKGASMIAAELSVPERVPLFCAGSGAEWARAGVTGATATAMVVKGLIERNSGDDLALTKDGRAVLDALLNRRAENGPPSEP
jgi:hypothetical protein